MRLRINDKLGSVLVTVLVITALVTIAIAALLTVVNQQNYYTARSSTWCSEIPVAEAGIEEAMAHLNSRPRGNVVFATNGWTLVSNNVVKARYFTNTGAAVSDSYFYTAISTTRPPAIVSVGYGRIPLQTNYTHRTVVALTKENPPVFGIVAKQTIAMGGATVIDSYNSTNKDYSTGGHYDPTKRHDQATVGTLSSAIPAISQGKIYGYAATGPGGTATGNIGDGQFMANGSPGIQSGHLRDDFNEAIPDATLPTNAVWLPYLGSPVAAGDWKLSGTLNSSIVVVGKVRLWVTDGVSLKGNDTVQITGNGNLEIYVGNTTGSPISADFGGGGVENVTQNAANFAIFGLPTCTYLKFHGNNELTGRIYAPNADTDLSGTPDIYGSIVAKSLDISGNAGIHYDEALGMANGPPFAIISWEEL